MFKTSEGSLRFQKRIPKSNRELNIKGNLKMANMIHANKTKKSRAVRVFDLILDGDGIKESLVFEGTNIRKLLKALIYNPDPRLTGFYGGHIRREATLPSGRSISGKELDDWIQSL